MILTMTVLGDPHGQMRPRFTKQGFAYKDKKQKEREREFVAKVREALGECITQFPKDQPLVLRWQAYFKIPKSRKDLTDGQPHVQKPDRDNIDKFICDCFNGWIWHDDAQVFSGASSKYWTSGQPYIEIEVRDISDIAANPISRPFPER